MRKSGWYKISNYSVYVEGGKVIRAIEDNCEVNATRYPYRYDRRAGGWINASGELSPGAVRAGIRRGTIQLM